MGAVDNRAASAAAFKGILWSPMAHELVSFGHVAHLVHSKSTRLGHREQRQVNGVEWEGLSFCRPPLPQIRNGARLSCVQT